MKFVYYILIVLSLFAISCNNGETPQRARTTCVNVDCGGNGTCKVVDEKAVCECNDGFHRSGLICEENGNSCIGIDCGLGKCEIENGAAACKCLNGYTGSQCDICDDGYQDNDNDKTCKKDCETSGLNCGEHGVCDDGSGVAECSCENGFDGALCSVFIGSKLTLKITDQWGRALDINNFTVTMENNGESIEMDSFDFDYNLLEMGDYTVKLVSEDYFPMEFKFKYIGENIENGIQEESIKLINTDNSDEYPVTKHAYVYFKEEPNKMTPNWHHTFYIGVAHKWFAPTSTPFSKNKVELYTNGEDAWNGIADALENAQTEINAVSWTYESDFTLRHPVNINENRDPYRITNMLNQGGSVRTRLIIAQLWKQDSWLTNWKNNAELKDRAEDANDSFEFMAQANPTNENYTLFFNSASLSQRLMDTNKEFRFKYEKAVVDSDIGEQYISPIVCGTERDEAGKCKFNEEIDIHIPLNIEASIASYHQKFFIIDRELAFVGGMNMAEEYWDSASHGVFEYRRMKYDSDAGDREEVRDGDDNGIKTPADIAPYDDYFTKIEGPLVKEVHNIFSKRWNYLIYNTAKYSENSTIIEPMVNFDSVNDGVMAQINVTMPRPFQENTILESQLLAIRQAKHYIYIEDQYFRMPVLNKAIAVRMNQVPDLKLIVITQPVGEWTDLGCFWTHTSYKFFMDNFANRVEFFQLKSFDYTYPNYNCDDVSYYDCTVFHGHGCCGNEMTAYFKNFYVHAKMFIVDDTYMSIGSCNKNNRGYLYEGEMNISVYDKTWVKTQRKKIFESLLGADNYSDVEAYEAEDFNLMFDKLKEIAQYNQNAYDAWDTDIGEGDEKRDQNFDIDYTSVSKEDALPDTHKPKGFLYPLSFDEPSDCLIEDVGDDAAK